MNNWPNPNALGEPKFPEIARPHFLSFTLDKSAHENLPDYVKQDTLLVGMWSPPIRQWLFMTGDMLTTEQVAAECDYISPCYTEEEMHKAQIDAVDDCLQICDGVYDNSLDYAESKGAMRCADQIEAYKESI